MIQEDRVPKRPQKTAGHFLYGTTCPKERVRLNYPSETTGGAREERGANEVCNWDWGGGSIAGVETKLTTAIGTDAAGPLCEIIWQDQAQREEWADLPAPS